MEKDLPIHLIVFLPLLGAAINGLLGRRFSWTTVTAIACIASLIPFVLSVQAFMHMYSTGEEVIRQVPLFTWFATGTFSVDLGFTIDRLTSVFCLNVTGIGFLIHMYSSAYMKEDPGYFKFMAYLNLFLFSMLMLIMGENLLLMFVGWEGVGLCSYLLIGFWYTETANADAGKKAFITNRVGDFGFLMGIFFILYALNTQGLPMTLSFHDLQENAGRFSELATIIGLLLFVGAAGKSAQVPLYVWLPDAMAGPTPVSALIHAATMVTAGVVMVTRLSPIFAQAPSAMLLVAVIGLFTAVLAAGIAAVQNDIKKVLAYSTVSQLGYMFLGCGVGAFAAGMFHVTTHAFFKALLFLGAGSVIHAMSGEQDMRKMGGLAGRIRVTHGTMVAGWLAIAGIPVFAGFWSKDLILNSALGAPQYGVLLYAVGVGTALLTAFYMTRLMAKTFWTPQRFVEAHGEQGHGADDSHGHGHGGVHESPRSMTVPLIVLAALSVVGGLVGTPWANAFEHFLEPSIASRSLIVQHEGMPAATGLLAGALVAALGVGTGLHAYRTKGKSGFLADERTRTSNPLFVGATNLWYIDGILSRIFIGGGGQFADRVWRWADRTLIDGAVNAVAWITGAVAEVVRRTQSGYLRSYAVTMLVGAAVVVAWVLGGSVRP